MTRGPAREKKPLGLVVDSGAVAPPPELRGPVSELVRQVVVELVREQLNGNRAASLGSSAEPAVSGPENAQQRRLRPGPKPKPARPSGAAIAAERRSQPASTRPAAALAAAAGVPSSVSTTGARRSPRLRSLTRLAQRRKGASPSAASPPTATGTSAVEH
jgi:hypothetical protein